MEQPSPAVEHIHKKDIAELAEDGYHIYDYYSKNEKRNFEIYQIEVEPGCDHTSIGHSSKSSEYVMLVEGELTLTVDNTEHLMKKDDALYFDASAPHSYRNDGDGTARAILLIQY